jgi:pre-mRNA-processing factor SLU7
MAQNKPPADASQSSRNEYIPSFISKRPFWAESTHSDDADYLEHQRLQSVSKDTLDKAKWYERGKKLGPAATKFRKGACENCGAMTHKTKECLSRPRKQGAKWTGRDIQADEAVEDVKLGWDAKRDRWNGYDSREYSTVVKEYEELEALKRAASGTPQADGDNPDPSDARYGEETDMGRSQPTSTRQLRLREDTAKYLVNLDLDSAKYDPKTRSMDTSNPDPNNPEEIDVSEGFTRASDAEAFAAAQKYAWETQETNNSATAKIHLQANPTESDLLRKKQTIESSEKKAARRKALLEKYGDVDSSSANTTTTATNPAFNPTKLIASEQYHEYDDSGRIKGLPQPTSTTRSKYAEDILTNNHTSVWGSWWKDFTWGYACCHSTVKNSYCTGDAGREAFEKAEGLRMGESLPLLLEDGVDGEKEERESGKLALEQEGDDVVEGETRQVDVKKQRQMQGQSQTQPKKRTLQELQSGISEEELESYKRNRMTADDPMAALLGRDELVQ